MSMVERGVLLVGEFGSRELEVMSAAFGGWYRCACATIEDARKALRSRSDYHYVVCDYNLSDGTGLRLLEHLVEVCKFATPVFLLVHGEADPELMEAASVAGVNALLIRPITEVSLSQAVRVLDEELGVKRE